MRLGEARLTSAAQPPGGINTCPRDHADFYVGAGPNARRPGSLADVSGSVDLAQFSAASDADTAEVLSATDRGTCETIVSVLLARQQAVEVTPAVAGAAEEKIRKLIDRCGTT